MGAVALDMSMSLDGFVTGPNPRAGMPLGDGGQIPAGRSPRRSASRAGKRARWPR